MSTPLAQNPTHENAEIQKIILQTRDAGPSDSKLVG